MRLRIEHRTSFEYDALIAEAYTELRLRPLGVSGQHCVSFRVATDPPGVRIRTYADHRGNEVHHFDVLEPHQSLVVIATSEVVTPVSYVDANGEPGLLERHDYLFETEYVPLAPSVAAFAAEHDPGGPDDAGRARALAAEIYRCFTYEPGVTDVSTPADEVLALGRGVCQDFAHLLIAACRCRGIPARYVSGYLYDPADAAGPAASHAWVDTYDPERGWVSVDPTHDREQTDAYVRVAVGLDYGEVPPTRGVYKGQAAEELDVRVRIDALTV